MSGAVSRLAARWMMIAGGLLLAIPMMGHAWVGWFSRYMADDYCTAGALRSLGFWPSQAFWYTTWSGRYSFTFLVTLFETVGVGVARILPGVAVAAWAASMALLFYFLGRSAGIRFLALAASLAGAAVVFVVLDGTPSPYQSLYWQTGMITYILPLILLAGLGAWLLWRGSHAQAVVSPFACVVAGLYSLIAGGFSETTGVLQVALLGLALVAVGAIGGLRRKDLLALMGSALIGACLALLLMYLAPGTQVRRELVSDPVSLEQLAARLIQDGRIFLSRTVRKIPTGLALAVVIPAAIGLGWRTSASPSAEAVRLRARRQLAALVLLPPIVGGLTLVTMAPYEFAVGDYPDARLLVASLFVLVTGLSIWGFVLGVVLSRLAGGQARWLALGLGVAGLLLVLAAVWPGTQRVAAQIPEVQPFAESWEARDQALRQAVARGVEETTAASLPHMGGLAEIGYDPNEWINRCVAQAYGLKRVIAK